MKRPRASRKTKSLFSIVGIFLLAMAIAFGASSSVTAATGSFDRKTYVPPVEGSNSDFERAWVSVTDTTANLQTSSTDTLTVTIKAANSGSTITYKLYETSANSSSFTSLGSNGTASLHATAVGSTTGYVEDFSGVRLIPGLGTQSAGALNIKAGNVFTAQNGDMTTSPSGTTGEGIILVGSSDTLQLLYGGTTLDSASVAFSGANDTSMTLNNFTSWGASVTDAVDNNAVNFKITLIDPNENVNPKLKDIIGFGDGFQTGLATGTSRIAVKTMDQSTADAIFSLGGTPCVVNNVQLIETGINSGTFEATGKVYGTSTALLKSNVRLGTTTSSFTNGYDGTSITLGDLTSTIGTGGPGVTFKILEISASGKIMLVSGTGTAQTMPFGTASLAFDAGDSDNTGFGTASWSATKVVASAATSTTAVLTGTSCVSAWNNTTTGVATSTTGIFKLIDGTDHCLVRIESWKGTDTAAANSGSAVYTTVSSAGSITVTLDNFLLGGPRSGDTIKVEYLDALKTSGTAGSVTSSVVFGTTGVAGSLSVSSTTADINDTIVVTVADSNLNTSSSTQQSIAAGNWNGTTTGNRGDILKVRGTKNTAPYNIDLAYPDNSNILGTQTIRVASTDQSLVWMIPSNAAGFAASSVANGSSTFSLGTQSTSAIPLVRGVSSTANSYLQSASTSSFKVTLDGLDNTLEISPDGTRWLAVPIVETGIDTGTFVGTIGFDCTAVRVTTNTTNTVSQLFSDSTGTTTIYFPDTTSFPLSSVFGTGSVVRIYDGTTSEFQEVLAVATTTLTVTKMSNSTSFVAPHQTWVQEIGNDMLRTATRASSSVFTVGGYYGATYRLRYNDASGASSAYAGGDTLAVTTSNVGFTTYTGSLAVDPSGTVSLSSQIVITVVDQDLNTSTSVAQSTVTQPSWNVSGFTYFNANEVGLGNPSGTSTTNSSGADMTDGVLAKELFASIYSSPSSSDFKNTTNTVPVKLVETAANSGTFKGTLQLDTSSTDASASPAKLKVSNGNTVTILYNDSPSATAENNLANYTTVSVYPVGGAGVLTLSKDTAFLSGDTVVCTVVDVDRNTGNTTTETLTSAVKVTGSNYSIGSDLYLNVAETAVNSGTFVATISTIGGTTTSASGSNSTLGTLPTIQSGAVSVSYLDTVPSASTSTKTLSLSSFDATLAFDADTYSLDSYAKVTLADAEQNTNSTTAQTLLSSVFIQTSSSNSTKVKMVETGVDTGTFQGSIKVASTGGTTEYNTIQATSGNTLSITYIDSINTTNSSRSLSDSALVTAATATPTPAATATPGATATPTPTPGTTGTIAGTVVSSALGSPIPGATVSTDTGGYSATTDAAGTFTITGVAAGTYTLTASATGFDSSSQSVTVTADVTTTATFDLTPSTATPTPTATATPACEAEDLAASPSPLSLKRNKSGTITVTVTCEDGTPVEGEAVTASTNKAGSKRVSIAGSPGTTDANGEVEFTITAKKKTGNAVVTIKSGSLTKNVTVKVRK